MRDYDEKRNFVRTPADCTMTYRLAGGDAWYEGRCLNLSGSGILFRAAAALPLGRAAEIRLVPEHRISPPLTAYIEVVRCERDDGGQYRIAGAIKGIKSA
jgi:hypothetical protein